jgi:hypothetical protein
MDQFNLEAETQFLLQFATCTQICRITVEPPALFEDLGWMNGVLGFHSRRGLGVFLFTTASRTALGPTQPLIQWVPRASSLGVKLPGREADHSFPSRAEVEE